MINDYEYIKKEKKFKLNYWELIQAYSFSLLLLGYTIYLSIDEFIIHYTSIDHDRSIRVIEILIFTLVIAIALAIYRKRTLQFKKFKIHPTSTQFQKAITTTSKEMHWYVQKQKDNFVIATFRNSWKSRETQQVTIFFDNEGVYMNSMTEFNILSFPISFGNRKDSFKKFIRNLECETKGIDSQIARQKRIKAKEEISEWSAYSMLKRLPAYFIILILAIISVGTFNGGEYVIVLVLSPLLFISAAYVYYDIKVINDKARKKKK